MSNTKELKKYLLEKENAFLLDDTNNGKIIMLSGAWGTGKTHFWQNEITREDKDKFTSEEYKQGLFSRLKEKSKACVYVSLYGKENIETLKNEILFKAYESIKDEYKLKKRAISAFGIGSKTLSLSLFGIKLDTKEVATKIAENEEEKKIEEAKSFLTDGGIICLDDFERKSNKIDLNDLFGFISQLAIDMNCKIIIILNSDIFTGKEAEVFKNVKEKTVNKFFYFEPTIEELFESISKNKKYDILNDYKKYILESIKETEELNARIYIQILDNCLEWLEVKEELNKNIIRVLVLGTFNFVLNHMVFDYIRPIKIDKDSERYEYKYKEINFTIPIVNKCFRNIDNTSYSNGFMNNSAIPINIKEEMVIEFLLGKNVDREYLEKNTNKIKALWKYGYRLNYVAYVDKKTYNKIAKFIKSGILI